MENSFLRHLSVFCIVIGFIAFTLSYIPRHELSFFENHSGKTLGLGNIASSNCTEPADGCGDGWYWDEYMCACVSSSSSQCQEPAEGCGENHVWDDSSCACTHVGDDETCNPPENGCPEDQFWNQDRCVCVDETECTPPASGCLEDQYWDSQKCLCKEDDACTEPMDGCGEGYYWSTDDCSCLSDDSTTSGNCYPAAGECEIGWEWNYDTCACEPIPTICQPPEESCDADYFWDYGQCKCVKVSDYSHIYEVYAADSFGTDNFDRLAYESPERILCVKSILTDSEYQTLRFDIGETVEEKRLLYSLGKKVEGCWQGVTVEDGGIASAKEYFESEKCLIQSLGNKEYVEIYQSERKPTYEEHLFFQRCYGNIAQSNLLFLDDEAKLPESVGRCLESALTDKVYRGVATGSMVVSPEFRSNVDACFGVRTQPFRNVSYKIPNKVENCLVEKLGEEELKKIRKGEFVPTKAQRENGLSCFEAINSTQRNFLPLSPEEVLFLKEDTMVVKVTQMEQKTTVVKKRKLGGPVTIGGEGFPGTVVTIYIYSDPVVVTTKTDANGEWVYELNQPLEGGPHIAYAVVKSSSGENVKSSIFNFTVEAADQSDIEYYAKESEVARNPWTRYVTYSLAMIVFATTGVMVFQLYQMFFKNGKKDTNAPTQKDELTTSADGQKDTETGTGAVN